MLVHFWAVKIHDLNVDLLKNYMTLVKQFLSQSNVKTIIYLTTVEPQYNNPQYNAVSGMMSILCPPIILWQQHEYSGDYFAPALAK